MKRILYLASWFGILAPLLASCGSEDAQEYADEGVGSVSEGLSKCAGGKVGASNYCSASCPCDDGEGDCDTSFDCVNGSCAGKGAYFYGIASNACAPAHCANGFQDADETQRDCGGSCGTLCPNACLTKPANCNVGHCTSACPCPNQEGDCANTGSACTSGFCKVDVGASYGCSAGIDICLPATCNNGGQDAGETGVDCGGTCTPCPVGDTQSASFGGTLRDHGVDVTYDSQGNYVVVGRYNGTANFGGAALTSAGGSDIYVAKYNSAGVHQWSRSFGGTGPDADLDVDVGTDGSNNVIISGNFWNSVDFGGGALNSAGSTDIFVVKLNASGTHVWSRRYGGSGADRVNAISVASVGAIHLAGAFQDVVSIANTNLTSAGNYDALLFKVASNGTAQWARRWGAAESDQLNAIGVDSASNLYTGGNFGGTVDFGTGPLTAALGSLDAMVLKTDPFGTVQWAKSFGGTSTDAVLGVAVTRDATRAPTFVGRFRGTANLGGGSVTSAGASDVFVVSYDTSGGYSWSTAWGGTGEDKAADAAPDAANNIIVVGDFRETVNFGTGAVSAPAGLTSAFAVKYGSTGSLAFGVTYGNPGGAGASGVATTAGRFVLTGDLTGSVNFGSGALTSLGQTDMFWAKLSN